MKKLAVMLTLVLLAGPAFAGAGALKLSLWGRAAVAVPNNINDVKGLEIGIGSAADTFQGVQFDLLFAQTREDMKGLSHALVTFSNEMTGLQGGFITKSNHLRGVQWGALNLNTGQMSGLQWGLYNQAESVSGLQVGFINYAKYIDGLQIGVLNIAENGWFPAMILVNGRF